MTNFPKIIFVGGKGGVGKSTISTSLALMASKSKKTLLISTDPAHNLGDIFKFKIKNQITKILQNLDAIEIDPQLQAKAYIQSIAKNTRAFVSPSSYDMVDSYYKAVEQSSSTLESALFERLVDIVLNEGSTYEQIIIDTAPTGHTLRLFNMSGTLKSWSKILLKNTKDSQDIESVLGNLNSEDPTTKSYMAEKIQERYLKHTKFNNLLKSAIGIIFVINPSFLSIEETTRAIETLKEYKLEPFSICTNLILPENTNDDFMLSRLKIQRGYMEKIQKNFGKYPMINIHMKPTDITGVEALEYIVMDIDRSISSW